MKLFSKVSFQPGDGSFQGARGARHISLEIVLSHHLGGFGVPRVEKAQKEAKHRLSTYAVHMLLKNSEAM